MVLPRNSNRCYLVLPLNKPPLTVLKWFLHGSMKWFCNAYSMFYEMVRMAFVVENASRILGIYFLKSYFGMFLLHCAWSCLVYPAPETPYVHDSDGESRNANSNKELLLALQKPEKNRENISSTYCQLTVHGGSN